MHFCLLQPPIVIQINAFKPVIQTYIIPLVLFAQYKPHEVFIVHLTLFQGTVGTFYLQNVEVRLLIPLQGMVFREFLEISVFNSKKSVLPDLA